MLDTANMIGVHTLLYSALSLSILGLIQRYRSRLARRKARRPPSPKSVPFFGSLFSIPPGLEHLAYMKLGEQLNSKIYWGSSTLAQPLRRRYHIP